jgi:hypothetical protein
MVVVVPWKLFEDKARADDLSVRREREVPLGHVLFGLKLMAVATRTDQDDVLFEIEGGKMPLAVVHMIWRKETDPRRAAARLFRSWGEWARETMLPDHLDFECPDR